MIISVINRSRLTDRKVREAIRAVNRQIAEDFEPHWGFGGMLRLEGNVNEPNQRMTPPELRGDAILYIRDNPGRLPFTGEHSVSTQGIPYGDVYVDVSEELELKWTVTLSHEAIEILADPQTNLLVEGRHPFDPDRRTVFYWFELCDPVQNQTYSIDGVEVSNFVLPLYFTRDEQPGSRNDFLGPAEGEEPLESFGVAPGGYAGFFDPKENKNVRFRRKDDEVATRRLGVRLRHGIGRGVRRSARGW